MRTHKLGLFLLLAAIAFFGVACNLQGGEATDEVLPTSTGTEVADATDEPTVPPTQTSTQAPTQTPAPTITNCTPRADWTNTYTVVSGDTLARIAVRGNTTVSTLQQGNCLANANVISVGQVLRVPNPVTAATPAVTATTEASSCAYVAAGTPPIYETQAFLTQIETAANNERYPVTRLGDSFYQIQLGDGRRGWVQAATGQLQGSCGDVLNYVEFDSQRDPAYECYYIGAGAFPTTVDQAGNTFAAELPPYFAYRVDGSIPGKVRIFRGEQVPFPVWASLNDGRIIGECGAVPDVSIATTQSVAKATYTDATYGYAFDYPSNWALFLNPDAPPGGTTGTTSFSAGYPSALGWPSDATDVTWGVLPPGIAVDAEELARRSAQDIENQNGRMQVLEPVEPYTTGRGLEGWRFVVSFPGATSEAYYFDLGEHILAVSISGNIGLGASVVESFRTTP